MRAIRIGLFHTFEGVAVDSNSQQAVVVFTAHDMAVGLHIAKIFCGDIIALLFHDHCYSCNKIKERITNTTQTTTSCLVHVLPFWKSSKIPVPTKAGANWDGGGDASA